MARGRRPKITIPLPGNRSVGASLKVRGDIYAIQFPHPTEKGKYVEKSTGCTTISDAQNEGSQIVLRYYSPTIAPDPKAATWEIVVAELEADTALRERSLEVYTSILNVFRRYVPLSNGPGDVTVEIAKAFVAKYGKDGFRRGHASDAKVYPRTKKTVENAIRKLSALWNKLMPKYVTSNPWEHVKRPTVPKTLPSIPTEDAIATLFGWLDKRYPGWELIRLFLDVKALSGCRLNDLCQVRSGQLVGDRLTIRPDQDKTHRERVIPLPADIAKRLHALKGPTYLWERYLADAKTHRSGRRTSTTFTPFILYNCIKSLFKEYQKDHPEAKVKSHDLRKRAITLMTLATQNVDQTAQAIGIDPSTARKYYLDATTAFEGSELMKRMASVLRPLNSPQNSDPDPA